MIESAGETLGPATRAHVKAMRDEAGGEGMPGESADITCVASAFEPVQKNDLT